MGHTPCVCHHGVVVGDPPWVQNQLVFGCGCGKSPVDVHFGALPWRVDRIVASRTIGSRDVDEGRDCPELVLLVLMLVDDFTSRWILLGWTRITRYRPGFRRLANPGWRRAPHLWRPR